MSAVDDAARMLTLVPWLLQRPGASVSEAAQALNATEKQITADLHRLDFCGLPGLGGGDLIEVHWFADRVILQLADELRRPLRPTVGEAVRLLLAAETVLAASAAPPPALVSALDKLREAVGIEADAVQSVDDPVPWLAALRDVLAATSCIRLEYQGRDDDTPRRRLVDPWRLELLDGHWYLHGLDLDLGEGRVFRLDRIVDVEPVDRDRGPVPDDLPTPAYDPDDAIDVVIHAAPGGRWLGSVFEDVEVDETGERTVLRLETDTPRHVATLVARAAGDAEAIAPTSLRRAVHDHASHALAAYASTGRRSPAARTSRSSG